jgi:Transposase DDE domain
MQRGLTFENVHSFLSGFLAEDIHAKRVLSLANATLGVMSSASLAVNTIGQGLALARGRNTKHAIKQVDRLLSNQGVEVEQLLPLWVRHVIGTREKIVVAMDWTEFDLDGQCTLMLSLISNHGRATPLLWATVGHYRRTQTQYQLLVRLAEIIPADTKVLIVADRGFGGQRLYRLLTEELMFDYVIRFRGDVAVTFNGETRLAPQWVGREGRSTLLRGASVTLDHCRVAGVVCVQGKGMKEPWCLATSCPDEGARKLIAYYGKRWSIECSFRDTKDLRFGMGMARVRVSTPERRDRLWLLNAFAVALLTLLGAAGEALGYDRHLKSNTAKHRTHSLFRQGCMLYELIPMMSEVRLRPLIECFGSMLLELPAFAGLYGAI